MFAFILSIITRGGYSGLFLLMVAENVFPPIPSEVILPLAGFAAARGELQLWAVIVWATIGAVVGCLPWYVLGRFFTSERLKRLSARYGRVFTFSSSDIDVAQTWFEKHGQKVVVFARLVPTVRTLISVPAGIARMPLVPFLAYSFLGSALWTTALVLVGYILHSEYTIVSGYIDPVAKGIVFLIVAVYLYRVITFRTDGDR